jgi:hypothetical protein
MEKNVWRMLFRMVEGCDIDSLLLELIEIIPWNALAAVPEVERRWFALSTTSFPIMSSPAVMSPTRSLLPAQAQTNVDLSPDSEKTVQNNQPNLPTVPTSLPQADGEEPMDTSLDTRPDGEHELTVNARPAPDLEGDKAGEDEQGQQSNDVEEMVPPTGSRPDAAVEVPRTSPAKRKTPTSPRAQKYALQKRRRRLRTKDNKNFMLSSGPSGETTFGHLLAAGESSSMPIDVEAVDVLMRNFPIIEEHQVRRIRFPEALYNLILRKQVFAKEISLSGVDKSVRGLFF